MDQKKEIRDEDKRKEIKFFISYARTNKGLATGFLKRFREQVAASKKYKYEFWQDTKILAGEKWHDEIQEALKECDIGLLLVSPAFLGSEYIRKYELSEFVGDDAKPLIPIMLQPVDFDRMDLKGLQHDQIFRLEDNRFRSPKPYDDCAGKQCDRFAQKLFRQVELRLDKLFGGKKS